MTLSEERYDVAVVGAGIVGLAVAREMITRRPDLRLLVIDKESEVAQHQTGHNSGVIHSGIYYAPGSLKARLCVEGARLMYEYCDANAIPYERCGKLIIALHDGELPGLDELEARGRANGVTGLRRVTADEIREIEPEARGVAALHSPDTGIVDYAEVARALERELRSKGVDFSLGCEVTTVRRTSEETVIETDGGYLRAARAVFCAGLWSDRLAVSAGASPDPRILPFRGAYLHVSADQAPVVRGMVYPVPDPDLPFLGVHVTKHIDGSVSLGPSAMLVGSREGYSALRVRPRDLAATLAWPGTWKVARRFWRTGVSELRMAASRRRFLSACAAYVPALASMRLDPGAGSGVRAQAVGRNGALLDDFVISETPGAFHVRNAPSPAATSSLALARELVDRMQLDAVLGGGS
ncbi:L-2-hydroxyglutarate oxidase [Nocardioides gansuensis]|uniref:L-2-hydroxyglutarate oxidase n=1 Tax=Nocardioides gansuensis TaxID=2138300 RepID=A0A2T8F622_9ACTN|nr:L-2-hydroxyglutarate oxidase [Nocardioides gansuensis]PVG81165.1 L-2-hydroxyglutarate oxidase [Nocardioides gansuensis]